MARQSYLFYAASAFVIYVINFCLLSLFHFIALKANAITPEAMSFDLLLIIQVYVLHVFLFYVWGDEIERIRGQLIYDGKPFAFSLSVGIFICWGAIWILYFVFREFLGVKSFIGIGELNSAVIGAICGYNLKKYRAAESVPNTIRQDTRSKTGTE